MERLMLELQHDVNTRPVFADSLACPLQDKDIALVSVQDA